MKPELALVAHKRHQRILNIAQQMNQGAIVLGKELYEMKENEEYEALGYETFESYLAMPELSFKRRTAYYLIEIYRTFVLELGYGIEKLGEAEWSKLALILPKIRMQPNAHKEWFNKALALSKSDLALEIAEESPCPHEDIIKISICANCHKKL